MSIASFFVRQRGRVWVVEESRGRQIGGIFATLVAALEFVDRESFRLRETCTVVERLPEGGAPETRRAS
jgi:hypothetical protein